MTDVEDGIKETEKTVESAEAVKLEEAADTKEIPKTEETKPEDEGTVEVTGEEDYSPEFTPIVQLEEVETVRSDVDEEIVWENKCKLYRYDEGAWKERALGIAKILKHKTTKKQRFIMHEDKTFKLRSNHMVLPSTTLQTHGGNPRALVFSTIDFADGEAKEESLCLRFGTAEKAEAFREKYEAAVEENKQYMGHKGEEKEELQSTAVVALMTEELGKTTVDDDKESGE